jgi:hypothetical protein
MPGLVMEPKRTTDDIFICSNKFPAMVATKHPENVCGRSDTYIFGKHVNILIDYQTLRTYFLFRNEMLF